MSNYLISITHPEYGLTLLKMVSLVITVWMMTDSQQLVCEFDREYGQHGWVVNYHSNMTMFDDRRTYLLSRLHKF